jgi:hypothetical protein
MNGQRDLATLLSTLEPELSDTEMVFCSFPDSGIAECPSGDFASHMSRLPVAEITA